MSETDWQSEAAHWRGEAERWEGEFKRLKPRNNFSLTERTWGAFELAARWAYIDITDENVRGGKEGRFSTALNWYLNPAVRMMFDWTRVTNADDGSITTDTASGSGFKVDITADSYTIPGLCEAILKYYRNYKA